MELEAPGFLFSLTSFIILLSILVFVHEWGHYIVARIFKIRVSIFSIGFGPEIFGWTDKAGTRWKISWVPLGGYVKFFGDMTAASTPDTEALNEMSPEDRADSFHLKPLAHRVAVVAAGPMVNFIFAILIFAGLYTAYGQPVTPNLIAEVQAGSAAEVAGFVDGDRIIDINGKEIETFGDIQIFIQINTGEALDFTIIRDGSEVFLTAVPELVEVTDSFGNNYNIRRLGISSGPGEIRQLGPIAALWQGTVRTVELVDMMLTTIGQIFSGQRTMDELGGPIKIAQFSGQSATFGLVSFITFMALISVNLGLVNLFPIPMLDGGHLMFYGIEAVIGRPVNARMQEVGFKIGLALVLGLFLLLTWNDITSLSVFSGE